MKRFKSAISILLCMAMLVSICVIGASAEGSVIDDGEDDVITTEGYSMSFNYFIGSGGNVLIVGLQGLTLSDTTDLTITWFDGGNPCLSFAEDEIIVEQPNKYHNDIELYLKSENLPSDNDIHFCNVRIESGSLTDSKGGAVNMIEEGFSLRPLDYSPNFYYYNPKTYDLYVGSYLSLHYDDYSDRYNGFTVTTETPETLSVRDNTTIDIIGAGDAQFTMKYNEFVYETFSFRTNNTKLGCIISTHTVSSIGEYFDNIENAFYGILRLPELILVSFIATPIFLIASIYIPFNFLCSLFGIKLLPQLEW